MTNQFLEFLKSKFLADFLSFGPTVGHNSEPPKAKFTSLTVQEQSDSQVSFSFQSVHVSNLCSSVLAWKRSHVQKGNQMDTSYIRHLQSKQFPLLTVHTVHTVRFIQIYLFSFTFSSWKFQHSILVICFWKNKKIRANIY